MQGEPEETKLVWPDKETEVNPPILPFQTVETVNEPRISEKPLDFSSNNNDRDWKNKLIWGDNKYILSSLKQEYEGKIDLIYIDPPFATGADFSIPIEVGDETVTKEPSIIEELAYRDTWGEGLKSYLQMIYDRLVLMRELLANTGSIFVHLDWHVKHAVRMLLEEIFGKENFQTEIIWQRTAGHHLSSEKMDVMTDTIFWFTKGDTFTYNQPYQKLSEEELEEKFPYIEEETGRRFTHEKLEQSSNASSRGETRLIEGKEVKTELGWRWSQEEFDRRLEENPHVIYWTNNGRPRYKRYTDEYKGRMVGNLWTDIAPMSSNERERTAIGFPTQKPERLLKRIVKMCSEKTDLVADFFCGSGTLGAVAEKTDRRWIMSDLSKFAIQTTRKRFCNYLAS